jgi:hypothetical protein
VVEHPSLPCTAASACKRGSQAADSAHCGCHKRGADQLLQASGLTWCFGPCGNWNLRPASAIRCSRAEPPLRLHNPPSPAPYTTPSRSRSRAPLATDCLCPHQPPGHPLVAVRRPPPSHRFRRPTASASPQVSPATAHHHSPPRRLKWRSPTLPSSTRPRRSCCPAQRSQR